MTEPRVESREPRQATRHLPATNHAPLFREMAVVGVGLIGGSLALAAKRAGAVAHVVGVDADPAHRDVALTRGIVERATGELEGIATADLVVLAVPVREIVALLPALPRLAKPSAIVTDVGSVKGPILAAGDAAFPEGRFVAGHPIAGRERSGPEAARPDLFLHANWIETPSRCTSPEALERVAGLCRAVGATVMRLEPAWHDEVFATVSHLPHLVAYALMDAVLGTDRGEERLRFSAGGLRDYTRVAASHPAMWRDIFLMNRDPLLKVLAEFREALGRLEAAIRDGDGEALTDRLARARSAREEIIPSPATR